MSDGKKLFVQALDPMVVLRLHDCAAVKLTQGGGATPEEQLVNTVVDFKACGPDATHAVIPIELYRNMLLAFVSFIGYVLATQNEEMKEGQRNDIMYHYVEMATEVFTMMNDWYVNAFQKYDDLMNEKPEVN